MTEKNKIEEFLREKGEALPIPEKLEPGQMKRG